MDLLMDLLCQSRDGKAYAKAAAFVEEALGQAAVKHAPAPRVHKTSPERIASKLQALMQGSLPHRATPDVRRYLAFRGLEMSTIPEVLRVVPRLDYFERQGSKRFLKVGEYPAMVAPIRLLDGTMVCVHRTYLDPHGQGKASVPEPRKMSASLGSHGGAIQLYSPQAEMAVAEGIESALAVHCLTDYPVWALVNEGLMSSWVPPPVVQMVHIYADHDFPDYKGRRAGIEAAKTLARRLVAAGVGAKIHLPKKEGHDFLDVYLDRKRVVEQHAA